MVRTGPLIGLIAQLALLAALTSMVTLGPLGWATGVTFGVITALTLGRGLTRAGLAGMGPANRVTLARAILVGGVTALIADSFTGPTSTAMVVGLSSAALAMDALDGWVARRTGTVSPLGARFDMEVDAFLIFVLSVLVVRSTGQWWVLSIGAARYAFVAAGWLFPWMRASLPPRYWRKVVAAIQGIVLTVAVSDVLFPPVTFVALVASWGLLAESFGRDTWWLWRHRDLATEDAGDDPTERAGAEPLPPAVRRSGLRTAGGWATTVAGSLLVWFALVAPNDTSRLTPAAFARLPVEGLVVLALVLVLPPGARRPIATLLGLLLGVLTVLKLLDMGFYGALDRPFNPVFDWRYAASAVGVLRDSIGTAGATAAVVAALVAAVALLVLLPLAVLRLTRLATEHRRSSIRSVTVFGAAWVLFAVLGVQVVQGSPIAAMSAVGLTYEQVLQVSEGIGDQQAFAATIAQDAVAGRVLPTDAATPDPAASTAVAAAASPVGAVMAGPPLQSPASTPAAVPATGPDLLAGLRGKDVIIAFVESYGRIAVQDSDFSSQVVTTLDSGTSQLQDSGFSARSAFLTSPTFGGLSWLAHSTLQSGLWIDNQQRYDQLMTSDRLTLSSAFKLAGWRTVADVPSNEREWPEGSSFYHYDQIYDESNVGYAGPAFSYASMPDQYTLSAFQRLEVAPADRAPVMAEIDLVSSHAPWAPLPTLVDVNEIGDGSIFYGMPEQGQNPNDLLADPALTRAAYGQSIQYSLNSLITFVRDSADDNLVMIVLGDHQPASNVTGESPSHDVPISIIAHDPAVLNRISGWGWQPGLRPDPQAPTWPMDTFRDRFLTAYGQLPG